MPKVIGGNSFGMATCTGCCTGTSTECTCDCLCCCPVPYTGTGTGTSLPGGYWSEYTFTIPAPDPSFGLCCNTVAGTWTVKYRGGCTWTTDETIIDDGITCTTEILGPGEPVWTMQLGCAGSDPFCITLFSGGYFATKWEVCADLDAGVFPESFCIDGGTLYQRIRSLAADCTYGPVGIGSDGGGGTPVTISPTGVFVPC